MARTEAWVKVHVRELHHPSVLLLTWEQRGVYWALHLLSRSMSDLKGFLVLDREPMTDEQIATALHAQSAADIETIRQAIGAMVSAGLVRRGAMGYELVFWNKNQAVEITEPRERVAARMRAYRARKRKRDAAPANIHELRPPG